MILHVQQLLLFHACILTAAYEIRVKAINMAGCGEQQYLYCFTEEGGSCRAAVRNVILISYLAFMSDYETSMTSYAILLYVAVCDSRG